MADYVNTNGMDRDRAAWMNEFCRGQEARAHGTRSLREIPSNDAFRAGYTDFGKYPLPSPPLRERFTPLTPDPSFPTFKDRTRGRF